MSWGYAGEKPAPAPAPVSEALKRKRRRNNPAAKPTGDHTGRCRKCGSNDLWDDNLAYGCNCCGAIYT